MTERVRSLDMTRGVAVLLMVWGHAVLYGEYGPILPAYARGTELLVALRMPVLILIGGLVAAPLMKRSVVKTASRCAGLIWLFLLWLPVNWMAFQIPVLGSRFASEMPYQLALETLRPSTVLWFIWMLCILTASVPIVRRLPRSLVAGVSLLTSTAGYAFTFDSFAYENFVHYSALFYVGLLYREELMSLLQARFSWLKLLTIVLTLAFVHMVATDVEQYAGWRVLGVAERILICVAALYGMRVFENIESLAKLMQWLGRNTLPIYVSHIPIIFICRMLIPDLGSIGSIVTPLLLMSLGVGLALYLHDFLIKHKARWIYGRPAWMSRSNLDRLRSRFAWQEA